MEISSRLRNNKTKKKQKQNMLRQTQKTHEGSGKLRNNNNQIRQSRIGRRIVNKCVLPIFLFLLCTLLLNIVYIYSNSYEKNQNQNDDRNNNNNNNNDGLLQTKTTATTTPMLIMATPKDQFKTVKTTVKAQVDKNNSGSDSDESDSHSSNNSNSNVQYVFLIHYHKTGHDISVQMRDSINNIMKGMELDLDLDPNLDLDLKHLKWKKRNNNNNNQEEEEEDKKDDHDDDLLMSSSSSSSSSSIIRNNNKTFKLITTSTPLDEGSQRRHDSETGCPKYKLFDDKVGRGRGIMRRRKFDKDDNSHEKRNDEGREIMRRRREIRKEQRMQHDTTLLRTGNNNNNTVRSILHLYPMTAPNFFCALDDDNNNNELIMQLLQKNNNSVKFIHMIRDPFDMAISYYLYHSQKPTPEKFVDEVKDPCLVNKNVLKFITGINMNANDISANEKPTTSSRLHPPPPPLQNLLSTIITSKDIRHIQQLCYKLMTVPSPSRNPNPNNNNNNSTSISYYDNFYEALQNLSEYDGLQLSTYFALFAHDKNHKAEGDILRMINNIVRLNDYNEKYQQQQQQENNIDDDNKQHNVHTIKMNDWRQNYKGTASNAIHFLLKDIDDIDIDKDNIDNDNNNSTNSNINIKNADYFADYVAETMVKVANFTRASIPKHRTEHKWTQEKRKYMIQKLLLPKSSLFSSNDNNTSLGLGLILQKLQSVFITATK
jgi:hypothetical protein